MIPGINVHRFRQSKTGNHCAVVLSPELTTFLPKIIPYDITDQKLKLEPVFVSREG